MTDEYFFIEEISPNSSEIESEKSNGDKKSLKAMEGGDNSYPTTDKKSQEIRLHEIEHQLEMAESRCNTLKGQVDYMKMLYNGMGPNERDKKSTKTNIKLPNPATSRKLSIDSGKRKKNDNESNPVQLKESKYCEEPPSRDIDPHPYRDRDDRQICEKDASAAVKSINNIISGITNSVNRLTQLQVQIGSSSTTTNNVNSTDPIGIQNVKCTPRYIDQIAAAEKPYQTDSNNQTEIKKSLESIRSKSTKRKRRIRAKSTSKQSVNSTSDSKKKLKVTAKHIEKRTRLINQQPAGDASQSSVGKLRKRQYGKLKNIASRTVLAKRSLNAYGSSKPSIKNGKQEWKSDKLIELYHNSAVKIITASEDSLHNKKVHKPETAKPRPPPPPPPLEQVAVQPVEKLESIPNIPSMQQQYRPQLSTINEGEIQYGDSYYQKNYELPTIAYKMKQVAKSYYQNFSFKTIPFVAAKSVTPSHNLGVNIQQVLSIIKGRKPLSGISPTLAYNIELAANKLGSRPLSALVSNLGSRLNNNRYVCPLAKKYPFSHLQELAKEIPEETIEEMNAVYEEDGPKITHPMAAGDKDVENQEKCWFSEAKKSEEKCTCVPKQGVSFNDVYTKYAEEKVPASMKRVRRRPWNENRRMKQISSLETYSNQVSSTKCNQISKRERSLKEVLTNLHDEFSTLNELYEELKAEVGNGKSDSTTLILEIERMEKDLQNKEDEITMVMSLYKEVMALKQQVRNLKTRAGQSTVVVSPFINRNREYKDMNAAGHLTKLLRHIQQFQETLKNKTR